MYNLFQRPWDFWPNFRSIYWMKWETRFSRLNLIIGLTFPVGKKGQLGKKNSVSCTPSLQFFLKLSTNISYKPYLTLRYQLLCSTIWLPGSNKSDRNRTGDSIQWAAWRPWILFHQYGDHLYFYSNYSVRSIQQNLPYFISELSGFMGKERPLIL